MWLCCVVLVGFLDMDITAYDKVGHPVYFCTSALIDCDLKFSISLKMFMVSMVASNNTDVMSKVKTVASNNIVA